MDQRAQIVANLIRDELSGEVPLTEMATHVNLSPSRLRHLFKAETGMSPAQYRKLLRMQRAKELIEATFLNIKEVMTSVGLSDKSHFVRDFRKAYGMTPTSYRVRHHFTNIIEHSHIR